MYQSKCNASHNEAHSRLSRDTAHNLTAQGKARTPEGISQNPINSTRTMQFSFDKGVLKICLIFLFAISAYVSHGQCADLPGWIVGHETCFDNNDGTICCNSNSTIFPTSCVLNPNAGSYNSTTHCFTGVPPLPPGQFYDVTVTYNNGCTDFIDNLVILENNTSAISMNPTITAACGATNGQICVNPTGGFGNYTYQWEFNTSLFQPPYYSTTNCAAGGSGTYWLRLRDYNPNSDNYCEIIVSYTILQSQPMLSAVTNPTTTCICPGGTGSIDLTIAGGIAPITISWVGPNGFVANTEDIAALCAGDYTVTVTSANGCASVATYSVGGIMIDWIGDLFVTSLSDLLWTSTDPWGAQYVIDGNVFVQTGANLVIEGIDVLLTQGHFIRISNGATLTAQQDANLVPARFDAACSPTWRGFQVHGVGPNPTAAQQALRGVLTLNQGTQVLHAECGISNFTLHIANGLLSYPSTTCCTSGGRIMCAGTQFMDNVRDVSLVNYVARLGDPTPPYTTELAQFINCDFLLTTIPAGREATAENGQSPRIYMDHVAEVYFFNCRGIMNPLNQYSAGTLRSIFIKSFYSLFDWYGCDENNNAGCNSMILGFTIGIWEQHRFNTAFSNCAACIIGIGAQNINQVNHISGTLFECPQGVYGNTLDNIRLINNTFLPINAAHNATPAATDNIRYYFTSGAQNDTRMRIAGNTFTEPVLAAVGAYPRAMHINMAGGALNFVVMNNINRFRGGLYMQDENRAAAGGGSTNLGMHYECNTFNNCFTDVTLPLTSNANANRRGVASVQNRTFPPIAPLSSAGNNFNGSTSTFSRDDVDMNSQLAAPAHTYQYDASEINNANQIAVAPFTPTEMSGNIQTLVDVAAIGGVQNPCDNSYVFNLPDFTGVNYLVIVEERMSYLEQKYILIETQDGGITGDLQQLVDNTTFQNALATYNALMAESPNLSESVLLSIVESEGRFPATMLTTILASNPHATTYPKVMWALENRTNPLDAYQMQLVMNARNNPDSPVELIQKQMAWHRLKEVSMRDLYMEVLQTDEDATGEADIVNLYHAEEFVEDRMDLANWYYAQGAYDAAEDLILTAANYFELDTKTIEQLELTVEVNQLQRTIENDQNGVMTNAQYHWLEDLWLSEPYGAGNQAMNLLVYKTGYQPRWPEVVGTGVTRRQNISTSNKDDLLKLYPNPVGDFAQLQLHVPAIAPMSIRLYSADGKLISASLFQIGQKEITMSSNMLESGSYYINLMDDAGTVIQSVSFIKI